MSEYRCADSPWKFGKMATIVKEGSPDYKVKCPI